MSATEAKSQRLSPNDSSSFSRPELVKVVHYDIHWKLLFDEHKIDGHVYLVVKRIDEKANELILDSNGLSISDITLISKNGATDEQRLEFVIGDTVPEMGEKIIISLPKEQEKLFKLRIDYATSSKAVGLQWMAPIHTSMKKHPFLFSQFQSIHARSALPCQDTPSLKATYDATVSVTLPIQVLMSAKRESKETLPDGTFVYKYSQSIPIPAYLIAIAAGDLEERKVGPRSSVWAEKIVIEKAAYEFAEVESMLVAAESLCGPYRWGIYDMLILPPTFPYGGMENPNLTFVTPTILAGDRSLADVIIHEITHSWAGNLVTNADWEHFWLNEGFTMFIQRKITAILHGQPARHLDAALGWKCLVQCVNKLGHDNPSTRLIPDLTGVDPESNYTLIPYEKGHSFLWYLETLVGEEQMNTFVRHYIDHFAPQAIRSDQFKELFYDFFSSKKETLDSIDWDTWFYKPGMPPVELKFDTSLIDCCQELLNRWVAWKNEDECTFSKDDLEDFSPSQIILFLTMMSERDFMLHRYLKKMDELYQFSSYQNNEIKFYWIKIGLQSLCKDSVQPAIDFINEQGRMRYIVPLYRELFMWPEMQERAVANFEDKKFTMMHCSFMKVNKELQEVREMTKERK